MASFNQLYNDIKLKVETATLIIKQLREENQYLQQDIEEKTQKIEELKAEIETLNEKNKIVTITNTVLYKQDKQETIKKINEYVREIDNCIGTLNSMEWTKKESQ